MKNRRRRPKYVNGTPAITKLEQDIIAIATALQELATAIGEQSTHDGERIKHIDAKVDSKVQLLADASSARFDALEARCEELSQSLGATQEALDKFRVSQPVGVDRQILVFRTQIADMALFLQTMMGYAPKTATEILEEMKEADAALTEILKNQPGNSGVINDAMEFAQTPNKRIER